MTAPWTRAAARLLPWSGWLLGGLGWAISAQFGSDLVMLDCGAARPARMVAIGAAAALTALAGAFLSFRHARASRAGTDQPHAGSTRFLALVSGMAALIFLGAILLQTVSSLIVPSCHG